jgi:hypothetical protein
MYTNVDRSIDDILDMLFDNEIETPTAIELINICKSQSISIVRERI